MGEDMKQDYIKAKAFFEGLDTDNNTVDLTAYYDAKALILAEVICQHQKIHDIHIPDIMAHKAKLSGNLEIDTTTPRPESRKGILGSLGEAPSDPMPIDDMLIVLYGDMLADDYNPPQDITELQAHLTALFYFYRKVRPVKISIRTIGKFDLVALRLCIGATCNSATAPTVAAHVKQYNSVSVSRKTGGNATKEAVLKAYLSSGAKWTDEGIKFTGTTGMEYLRTLHNFTEEHFEVRTSEGKVGNQTVRNHLKKLKKEGKI